MLPAPPTLEPATPADIPAIVAVRNASADHLRSTYGAGYWALDIAASDVQRRMTGGTVMVWRRGADIIATLSLTTRKPWSINVAIFPSRRRPVYLSGMAVDPRYQRLGIGRACLTSVVTHALGTHDAIRLDAYDLEAGAGAFYQRCGYTEVGRGTFRGCKLRWFELAL